MWLAGAGNRAAAIERIARLLHLHRLLRIDVAPVQIAPPWGVTLLDLPGRVPLPAKITVEVLPATTRQPNSTWWALGRAR